MTERELQERIRALVAARNGAGSEGVEGFGDIVGGIFNAVKTAAVTVGKGIGTAATYLASGVKSLVSGGGTIVSKAASAVSSDTTKALLEVAAGAYAAKQAAGVQEKQLQLQLAAQSQQQVLAQSLASQGVVMTSPEGQKLVNDIIKQGVVSADGKIIYPSLPQQVAGVKTGEPAGFFASMSSSPMVPILAAVAAVFGVAVVMRPSPGERSRRL